MKKRSLKELDKVYETFYDLKPIITAPHCPYCGNECDFHAEEMDDYDFESDLTGTDEDFGEGSGNYICEWCDKTFLCLFEKLIVYYTEPLPDEEED